MLREELGLAFRRLRRRVFECFGYLRVQLLAGAAQQAVVRRVLNKRVLENVDRTGRRAALEHQFRSDKAGKRGPQLVLWKARYGVQELKGEFASDRGANLRHP